MSGDDNLAIVQRFVEDVMNRGDYSAIDRLIASEYVDHAALPGTATGQERVRQVMAGIHSAFPDFEFEVAEMLPVADKVVLRGTVRGTHRGEFMGMAPTGRAISVTQIHIIRLADGKIVEHWAESDWLCAVYQLGAIPSFLQAVPAP